MFRYALIESYLGLGQLSNAQNEVAVFPNEVNLDNNEFQLEDWYGHLSLYSALLENETDSMDLWNLNTSTKGALTLVALDTLRPISSIKAIGLLLANGDTLDYVEPIPEPQTQNNKVHHSALYPNRPEKYFPQIRMNPNPTEGIVNVSWFGIDWLEASPKLEISVLDITGKKVFSQKCEAKSSFCTIQLGHLPSGVYNLQVFNSGELVKTEKLLLKP